MTKPVIMVEGIYPQANNWNSVLFTKVVKEKSLLSLAVRGQGHVKEDGSEIKGDKKLTAFVNFTTESLQNLGISVGIDINSLGHDSVYDLIEKYNATLSKDNFDENGNVMVEPVINISTREVQLYSGKIMFRTVQLVEAASVAELPKSDVKPTRTGYIEDIFDQETHIVEEGTGKKRKTPEYQAYLNNLYSLYCVPSTIVPVANPQTLFTDSPVQLDLQEA